MAAIIVSTGVLIWLAYDGTPAQSHSFDPNSAIAPAGPPQPGTSSRPAEGSDSVAQQIARLEADLKRAFAERDEARRELAKLRAVPDSGKPESDAPAAAFDFPPAAAPVSAETPAAPRTVAPPPMTATAKPAGSSPLIVGGAATQRAAQTPNRRLAGFWFYAVPPEGQKNKNHSLYLPEYIEATISEDNGAIHGRYRSRFMITDRAITPDVNFTFTGMLNGTQCNCEWTGGGGAKGTVTLKLTGDNSMKVDWAATELGSLGLASGTAILTRNID